MSAPGPLIPTATTPEQRHFEALFLRVWVSANDPVALSFLAATHPAPDLLSLSVSQPAFLLPLLSDLLLRRVDGHQAGVRAYPWRDFVELRMVGADNDIRARIRLYGVNRNRAEGRALLERAAQFPQHHEWSPGEPLSSREPTDAVLSDLLRRFPLWRTARQVSIGTVGHVVRVGWRGGPHAHDVLALLRSASCGIEHAGYEVVASDWWHELRFHAAVYQGRSRTEPWRAWEAVHARQVTGSYHLPVAPCRPPAVTPSTWEDSEMRNALAAREVSTIYKLLRRQGVSQRQIAAMTGQSQSEVSEILKGRQVMAYDVLVRIADGLGVPRRYMGLAYEEVTPRVVEESEEVKRRRFLAHAASVAVDAHVLGADRDVTPAPSRIEMTDVRQVEAAARALRSLDHQYGAGYSRDAVAALNLRAEGLLATADDVGVRKRLLVAMADLNRMTTGLWVPGDPWPGDPWPGERRKGEHRG